MKLLTLCSLALLVIANGDPQVPDTAISPLEHEVSLAERAVADELNKEHAPAQIMQKEMGFLKNVENAASAVRQSGQSRHRVSLLSGRTHANTQAAIANNLEFAEHAIESELHQDHAPAQLISEEKALLGRAYADVHHASQLQTELQNQYKQTKATLGKEAARHETAQGAFKAYKQGMEHILADDKESLAAVQHLEGQTAHALQEARINASAQDQVKNLLAKVENIERNEVALEQRSVLSASQEDQEISHHNAKQGAQQALAAFKEGMTAAVHEGKKMLSSVQDLEHKAMHALQEAHADATTQKKVDSLLSNVESLEHQQIDLAEQSVLKASQRGEEISHNDAKRGAQKAFKAFKEGMAQAVYEGKTELSTVRDLEHKAMHALQEAHANATTQKKVDNLLSEVETLEHQQIDVAERSLSKASQQETSQEGYTRQITEEGLEEKNVQLQAKNDQLKQEHAKLLHEKELVDENSALEAENAKLIIENAHLRHGLNIVA